MPPFKFSDIKYSYSSKSFLPHTFLHISLLMLELLINRLIHESNCGHIADNDIEIALSLEIDNMLQAISLMDLGDTTSPSSIRFL